MLAKVRYSQEQNKNGQKEKKNDVYELEE